jgi:hypothetical protein
MAFYLRASLIVVPVIALLGCQSTKPLTSMFAVQSKVAAAPAKSSSRLQVMTNLSSRIFATPNSTCYKTELEGTGTVLTNFRGGLFKDPNQETLSYNLDIEKPTTLQKAIVYASATGTKAFSMKDIDREKFSILHNVASKNGTITPERWQEFTIASLPLSKQEELAKNTILTERYLETGKPISFSLQSMTSDGQYSCHVESYFNPQANTDYRLIGEIVQRYSKSTCHLNLYQKSTNSSSWQLSTLQKVDYKDCQ